VRGWTSLYRTSIALGLRDLMRHGYHREAVVRVLVPLDPSRYLELPWALAALPAAPGEQVLDLASPKLLAVALGRRGVRVTTVDELEPEIEAWRRLAEGEPNVRLVVADGRALPFQDGSFDHATSISVLEHIPDGGDAAALAELARCVRRGGRIAVTVPYAARARNEYRDAPLYVDHGETDASGRAFFQRWYDAEALEALVAAVPALSLEEVSTARLQPNLNAAYTRTFPLLVPLGPLFGLLARERLGPDGDVARLLLART
jgi:SAM-dependent methyltransferase